MESGKHFKARNQVIYIEALRVCSLTIFDSIQTTMSQLGAVKKRRGNSE